MWPRVHGHRTLELGAPGASRDWLNGLVLAGRKRGTAGLLAEDYQAEGEEVERVGERLVLLDNDGAALTTVIVTAVRQTTFAEVTWDFAASEGEGDTSIEQWRAGHRAFWSRDEVTVTDDTPVVCVSFRLADGPGPTAG
jgi:uncharacterized protein YhfF